LFHGSQEALGIEESSQPESIRSIALVPLVKLLVSFNEIIEPFGESWDNP